jgi:cysteine synthase A
MNFDTIRSRIGNTPIVEVEDGIYAKLESKNPFGSVKDRVAFYMLEDAYKNEKINNNSTIIEATSGNTGIALAAICKELGLKCIIVMPDNVSQERANIINSYGADVVKTPSIFGMSGAIDMASDMALEIKDSYIPSQFKNKTCVTAHYKTTGPEIYESLPDVDIIVSGIGTGGTITGISKYMKRKNDCMMVGVEPLSSPFLTKNKKGPHKIQGIGAGFLPDILDLDLVDEIITVSDDDAIKGMKILNNERNISAGISAGAAYMVALKLKKENKDKKILFILPDDSKKYESLGYLKD